MPKRSDLPRITDLSEKDIRGTRVFLRASLNVPVEDGIVTNQFRLSRGLATINFLVEKGAKVILAGHMGREKEATLKPVYEALLHSLDVRFSYDVAGADTKVCIDEMQEGQVVLLENLRRDPREVKNDPEFARDLASLADTYVNDAFSVSHREHASIVGIPRLLPAYVGLNFVHECEELAKAMNPKQPSLFLLGGAKFETKMPVIEKYHDVYGHIFVGGALAHPFFKAKGYELGTSLVPDEPLGNTELLSSEKILLPVDVTVMGDERVRVTTPDAVEPHERIVDAGPATMEMLAPYIAKAAMVLWNGPFGDYEHGFGKETERCAQLVAEADGYSVVGGGDTVAAIESLNQQERFSFLSTAGGAMLAYLENGTLPGIEAIHAGNKK